MCERSTQDYPDGCRTRGQKARAVPCVTVQGNRNVHNALRSSGQTSSADGIVAESDVTSHFRTASIRVM